MLISKTQVSGFVFFIFAIFPQLLYSLFIYVFRSCIYPILDPYLFQSTLYSAPSYCILTGVPIILYSMITLAFNKINGKNKFLVQKHNYSLSIIWVLEIIIVGVCCVILFLLMSTLEPILYIYNYMIAYIISGSITSIFLLFKIIYHHCRYRHLQNNMEGEE